MSKAKLFNPEKEIHTDTVEFRLEAGFNAVFVMAKLDYLPDVPENWHKVACFATGRQTDGLLRMFRYPIRDRALRRLIRTNQIPGDTNGHEYIRTYPVEGE